MCSAIAKRADTKEELLANILCIGTADASMQTRRMILERAGYKVTEAGDLRKVILACQSEVFDIAILGQSLPAKEKMRISDILRIECRAAKVLELHTGLVGELLSADAHLRLAGAPEGLIDCVETLLSTKRRQRA